MFYLHMFFILVCGFVAYYAQLRGPSSSAHTNMFVFVANILAVVLNAHAMYGAS